MGRRKAITAADIRPFLERTGQLHLLQGLADPQEGAGNPPKRLNLAVSAPSGGNTADLPPEGRKPGKKRREMNKTEAEFSLLLEAQRRRGEIVAWQYEAITLRWGTVDVLKYTPDFMIFDLIEGFDVKLRFIEVKGAFIRQIDLRRFKEARNAFTMFRFDLWQKTKETGWMQQL